MKERTRGLGRQVGRKGMKEKDSVGCRVTEREVETDKEKKIEKRAKKLKRIEK